MCGYKVPLDTQAANVAQADVKTNHAVLASIEGRSVTHDFA